MMNDATFKMRVTWDGLTNPRGSFEKACPCIDDSSVTWFQANHFELQAALPAIAKNVMIVPTARKYFTTQSASQLPHVWGRGEFQRAYQKLIESYGQVIHAQDISGYEVYRGPMQRRPQPAKYVEISKRVENDSLIWEIEVENLSLESDIRISGGINTEYSTPIIYLDASGRALGSATFGNDRPKFIPGKDTAVYPGSKSSTKIEIPLGGNGSSVKYIYLPLDIPGRGRIGWKLLPTD
jgi:hypothetical protein